MTMTGAKCFFRKEGLEKGVVKRYSACECFVAQNPARYSGMILKGQEKEDFNSVVCESSSFFTVEVLRRSQGGGCRVCAVHGGESAFRYS